MALNRFSHRHDCRDEYVDVGRAETGGGDMFRASAHRLIYSSANATFAKIVIRPARAAISKCAEAPRGLRIAAITTLVSRTHLTHAPYYIAGDVNRLNLVAE